VVTKKERPAARRRPRHRPGPHPRTAFNHAECRNRRAAAGTSRTSNTRPVARITLASRPFQPVAPSLVRIGGRLDLPGAAEIGCAPGAGSPLGRKEQAGRARLARPRNDAGGQEGPAAPTWRKRQHTVTQSEWGHPPHTGPAHWPAYLTAAAASRPASLRSASAAAPVATICLLSNHEPSSPTDDGPPAGPGPQAAPQVRPTRCTTVTVR